jgi:hypothetical protein
MWGWCRKLIPDHGAVPVAGAVLTGSTILVVSVVVVFSDSPAVVRTVSKASTRSLAFDRVLAEEFVAEMSSKAPARSRSLLDIS